MRLGWLSFVLAGVVGLVGVGPGAAQTGGPVRGPLWQEAAPAPVAPELARLNEALTRLADALRPALVQIRVGRRADPDGEDNPRRAMGSGFLIHPDGYLVTNAHVVEGATTVEVRLATGRRLRGTVLGRDSRVDLALVKVESPEKLPVLPLGDSNQIRVGELVLALGNPFGLDQTVSFGIVGRKGAALLTATPFFDFIQTDAAVNPGNSGGPLVNMAGQVIGVNTMAARNGSLGFAIPANLVKGLLPQLLEKGKLEWGWLGVRIDEITEDNAGEYGLSEPRGVGIEGVMPDQPGAQAGLKAKDVVVSIDGSAVATPRDLQRIIASTPVGKTVRIVVVRDGREQEVPVTIGRRPEAEDESRGPGSPRPPAPR